MRPDFVHFMMIFPTLPFFLLLAFVIMFSIYSNRHNATLDKE